MTPSASRYELLDRMTKVFCWQACDVWAGSANILEFDQSCFFPLDARFQAMYFPASPLPRTIAVE
jgi:hypothetical protein